MMTIATLEREIKLRYDSADAARASILATGAVPLHGRRLQEDALLDTDDEQLRQRRCALRIRTENGKSRLTFKGPVQPAAMKVREELETLVGDGEVLLRVMQELGLHVWFRYEKFREEFTHEDVIVALDETPVGVFVEIEGSEQGITQMAEALGKRTDEYVVASYRGLFLEHRAAFGLTGSDMLFDPALG
jgi:adenylate cyclase class 2